MEKINCSGNFFYGGTELPNVMFMYVQYAGWMARMDGRGIERARASIKRGKRKRSRGKRRIKKNNKQQQHI